MAHSEAALVLRITLFSLVATYLVAVWTLLGQLQAKRPELYDRLGRPTGLFSPLRAGTYRLGLLILPGYPEFSPQGVRVPLWIARIALILSLLLMFNSSVQASIGSLLRQLPAWLAA